MDFREATDRLRDCPTLEDIGAAMGITWVRQSRLNPDSAPFRAPPADWPTAVARLAREHAEAMLQLAEELERA